MFASDTYIWFSYANQAKYLGDIWWQFRQRQQIWCRLIYKETTLYFTYISCESTYLPKILLVSNSPNAMSYSRFHFPSIDQHYTM